MDVSPTGDEGRMGGVAACARSACDEGTTMASATARESQLRTKYLE